MAAALPLLKAIFPFLQEYVLDGKTIKESWKSNKKMVVILFALLAMIGLIAIGGAHIAKQYSELTTLRNSLEGRAVRGLKSEVAELKEEKEELLEKLKGYQNPPSNPIPNKPLAPPIVEGEPGTVTSVTPSPIPGPKKPLIPSPQPTMTSREDFNRVKDYQDFLDRLNQ